MKSFSTLALILIIFQYVAGQDDPRNDPRLVLEKCMAEQNVPLSEVERYEQQEEPQTLQEKCVLQCMTIAYDVITDKKIALSPLRDWIRPWDAETNEDKEKLNQVVDICYKENENKVSDETCELGTNIKKCIKRNLKALSLPEDWI